MRGISPFIIGMVIIGFGTSAPDVAYTLLMFWQETHPIG